MPEAIHFYDSEPIAEYWRYADVAATVKDFATGSSRVSSPSGHRGPAQRHGERHISPLSFEISPGQSTSPKRRPGPKDYDNRRLMEVLERFPDWESNPWDLAEALDQDLKIEKPRKRNGGHYESFEAMLGDGSAREVDKFRKHIHRRRK